MVREVDRNQVEGLVVGLILILGLLLLGYLLKPVLVALSLSLVLFYLVDPIFRMLTKRLKRKWASVTLTFFFVLLPFFIFTFILSTTVASEVFELSKTPQAKEVLDILGGEINKYLSIPSQDILKNIDSTTFSSLQGFFTKGLTSILSLIKALGSIMLQTLLGIFLTVYLLIKSEDLGKIRKRAGDRRLNELFSYVDEALKQVVYSMILTAGATGIMAIIVYKLFNVPFAVLWGTTTGIIALIPLLGTWLVYIPITGYFLLQGKTILALLFFLVCLIVVTILPDIAVRPLIASKTMDIGLIVLGFITGTMAFGAIGFIIGPLILIGWSGFAKIYILPSKDEPQEKSD